MKLAATYRVVALALLTMGTALPALAQNAPRGEISAGYQLLAFNEDELDETLGKGWYVDVSGNLGPVLSIVVQVSGNYKSYEETESVGGVTSTANASLKIHEFLGGLRVNARGSRSVVPYAQALFGGVSASIDADITVTAGGQTVLSESESDSATDFGMQLGGGVTIWMSEKVGVRGAADYLRIFGDDSGVNAFRVAGGVVFGF